MSNKNEMKLVPRLRFPEFRDTEGWETMQIGKLLKFQTGFPFDSGGFNEEGIGVRLIRNRDLKSDDKIIYYSKNYDEKFLVYDGDILVGMDGDFTPCTWNKGKALLNQRVGRVFANEPSNQRFFYYLLSIQLKAVEEATARTTVKHLSHSDVEKIKAYIPSSSEQQKIADCLSSLDELVAAECAKLEAMKAHKKGLMQQLFPAEGETVPALRFEGFEGEWEERELSELGKLIPGLTYRPEDVVNEGLLVLRSSNIQNGQISLDDCVYVREDIRGANLSQPNDILICVRNGSKPLIGKNALIPVGIPTSTHGAFMTIFRSTSAEFVFQLFQTDSYSKQVSANLGATINSINSKDFLKYRFTVPEPKEQQKIAECLSSLDTLISNQAEKIETLRLHKKALMQRLFP